MSEIKNIMTILAMAIQRPLYILLLTLWGAAPSYSADALVMGVFPRHNYTDTVRMFMPMAKYLSVKLGVEVRLETAKDFPAFWRGITGKRYDIVHYNQYQYLRSHKDFGYEIILKNEELGKSTLASVILVRQDSGINSLQDLKGKKIIFGGGKKAMLSYIVPISMLKDANLQQNDLQIEFARNPPNALMAVYLGQATACGVGESLAPALDQLMDLSKFKIISKSRPIPHLTWAVNGEMDKNLRDEIQTILSTLKQSNTGKQILQKAKLTNMLPALDSEYDIPREIIKRVLDEEL